MEYDAMVGFEIFGGLQRTHPGTRANVDARYVSMWLRERRFMDGSSYLCGPNIYVHAELAVASLWDFVYLKSKLLVVLPW